MFVVATVLAALFVASSQAASDGAAWDYKTVGRDWGGVCRTGRRQSPIAMSLQEAVYDEKLGELKFTYSKDEILGDYANNGHSVVFVLNVNATKPQLSGGGLKGTYLFHSLHYHWGQSDCDGSEHITEYNQAPLEVHLVHYNAKYGSLGNAKSQSDGLAVVGILFDAAKDSSSVSSKVGKFLSEEWSDKLDDLKKPGSKISDKLVDLSRYIEDIQTTSKKFFRYLGSLTTPTCDESVTWTVITKRADIDPALLVKFRATLLNNAKGEQKPSLNYRHIQKMNGRIVYTNDASAQGSIDGPAVKKASSANNNAASANVITSLTTMLVGAILCR